MKRTSEYYKQYKIEYRPCVTRNIQNDPCIRAEIHDPEGRTKPGVSMCESKTVAARHARDQIDSYISGAAMMQDWLCGRIGSAG